jgi:PEP-CTERM/exosortase A-associated glycosyltransferase
MSLRILHVLDHSPPLHSGYVFRTLAILREQRRLGWETYHLTTPKQRGADALEEVVDGWHFFRTPDHGGKVFSASPAGYLRLMAATARRIAEVAEQVRPHLLHAHSPVLNALPAIRVGRRLGVPVIYEVRASWEDAAVDHGTTTEGSLRYRASRWLETHALRNAAQVTTICEGLRADIVARGIAPSRVTVIPNAVDVEAFQFCSPPDEALRAALGLDGATVLGFAGSFYGYEGLDLLIAALPKLLPRYPRLRVLLVGGGPEENNLRAQAAALGLGERILFTGRVPHGEVQRYYNLIDVLVYARKSMRLTELVTPLKPLEAMAQGRLLVASDVGGHRELIRDGETGVLFAAGEVDALATAVDSVLNRTGDWQRIRAAGRAFVERERNWRASVARYAGPYERALPPGQRALVTGR